MTAPFIVYSLPRSRTYWLSKLLSVGAWKCGHEQMIHIRGMDDIKSLIDMPYHGSVETAAAPWWRLIHAMRPDIKAVTVRRPIADVVASMMATGVAFDEAKLTAQMRYMDAKLDQIEARVPGVLSVAFDDLDDYSMCARMFEHCTGMSMPIDRSFVMQKQNLQIDLEAMVRYYRSHQPQLERVGRIAKQHILAKIGRRPVSSDAMTFQQEPFDVVLADGQKLFEQHCIGVGEHPDNWASKNLDLIRALEKVGALYFTTARSNGRMFGYLMSVISPALDSQSGVDAVQTLFYASPDAPGVGMKLQRASIDFLRTKGVNRVAFRAGPRGYGERISNVFKRLGAQDAGHMFTLDLEEPVSWV